MKRLIITCLIIIGSGNIAMGALGDNSFEFLLIGSGARSSAMAESFTAVSGDAGAPFYNPASAAVMRGSEISFAHAEYLDDATLEHVSMFTGWGKSTVGLNVVVGRVADIERRANYPSSEPLGTFDEHNFSLSAFWGRSYSAKLAVGLAYKFAYEKLDILSATASAVDLGVFYSLNREISLGGSIRNLGTKPKFSDKAFDLPREIRTGIAYRVVNEEKLNSFIVSADMIYPEWGDEKMKYNLGGEYGYKNLVFARLGYHGGWYSRTMTFGGGLAYQRYIFDYAFVPVKNNLRNTHRLTFRISL